MAPQFDEHSDTRKEKSRNENAGLFASVPGYGNSTSGVKSEGSPADRVSLMILDMSLHCIPCLFLKDYLRY